MRIATARDLGAAVRQGSPKKGEPTDLRPAERASATTLRLGALYQELAPRLVRSARRLTRDGPAAEDVVHTAFEKALRHMGDFRGEARLSTWLHRIVTNEALVWLRTERRRARHLQHDAESARLEARDPAPQAPEVLQLRERAARVREGLGHLGIAERDVLLRVFMEDQNYATIATQSAAHHGAIKTRAFRARRRLRVLLAGS
jgi:RNA polymerase sigma-70 factor, ECF subfamily